MLSVHRETIVSNLSALVEQTDLNALVPALLAKGVFNRRMIERILNPSLTEKRIKTNLYLEVLNRGPDAFHKLKEALQVSNHRGLASILGSTDPDQSTMIHRSNSLNSLASEPSSENSCGTDGPFYSVQRAVPGKSEPPRRPDTLPDSIPSTSSGCRRRSAARSNETTDVRDFQYANFYDPTGRVFAAPTYGNEDLGDPSKNSYFLGFLSYEQNKPVRVKLATHWQEESAGKPRIYKMDSNPRGCALLINNRDFYDKIEYPTRTGSENDVSRYTKLLEQLHFSVEPHENKTKAEMEEIVTRFSQKEELWYSDCIWVTIMSHGEEGDSDDNHEIIGVDGLGYKSNDIIARFFSDACPAGVGKAKLFFLQSCRGPLIDPGVTVPNSSILLSRRTATDGRRMQYRKREVKVRRQSDILVVYPTAEGFMANRDLIIGTWFIQTVVDVFSENAHNTHLDDLIKMVDAKIKTMNSLNPPNLQSVETKSIGWDKNLYFNPGLFRDATGATVRINGSVVSTPMDEGLDVVDVSSTNSDRSPNGATYLRFKGDDATDSEKQDKSGCFNIFQCKSF